MSNKIDHSEYHLNAAGRCKIKSYVNQYYVRRHLQKKCGTEAIFSCTVCTKRFKRKGQLQFNVSNVHEG